VRCWQTGWQTVAGATDGEPPGQTKLHLMRLPAARARRLSSWWRASSAARRRAGGPPRRRCLQPCGRPRPSCARRASARPSAPGAPAAARACARGRARAACVERSRARRCCEARPSADVLTPVQPLTSKRARMACPAFAWSMDMCPKRMCFSDCWCGGLLGRSWTSMPCLPWPHLAAEPRDVTLTMHAHAAAGRRSASRRAWRRAPRSPAPRPPARPRRCSRRPARRPSRPRRRRSLRPRTPAAPPAPPSRRAQRARPSSARRLSTWASACRVTALRGFGEVLG